MPVNVVKTPEDERLWEKAKGRAKEEGQEDNWAYVMGIFKRMKGKKAALVADDLLLEHLLRTSL